MALIQDKILSQNFEVIRDKIGEILAIELSNQAILAPADPDIDAKVYVERSIPFDKTDLPAVNVMLSEGEYIKNTTIDSDGNYTYFIDVYHKSKTSDIKEGDKTASVKLHKLLGVCMAILENPIYRTLGIQPPSIQHTSITSLGIRDNQNNQDAVSVMMGRLSFDVRVSETVKLINGVSIGGSDTSVTLQNTSLGYMFVNNG